MWNLLIHIYSSTAIYNASSMASWDSKVSIECALQNLSGSIWYFLPTDLITLNLDIMCTAFVYYILWKKAYSDSA